jgi:hypothetical protein
MEKMILYALASAVDSVVHTYIVLGIHCKSLDKVVTFRPPSSPKQKTYCRNSLFLSADHALDAQ